MTIKPSKQSLISVETPWLKNHIEGHLIFGPLSKWFPFGWILSAVFTVNFIWAMAIAERSIFLNLLSNLDKLFFIIVTIYLLKTSKYHQAAIGWCVTKTIGGLLAFMMLLVGGIIGKLRGQPDAAYVALLALIWIPGLEFIPRFVEKQKVITLTRIVLSLPIIYLLYQIQNM